MPVAASKAQYRFMRIIASGGKISHPRGTPPVSIAAKYTDPGKGAPESKNNDRGGTWTEEHHKAHRQREADKKKKEKHSDGPPGVHKRKKKNLKKAFEEFYKGRGRFAATLIMDNHNNILLGTHVSGGLAYPGGSVEPNETFGEAALREMHEECGAVGRLSGEIWSGINEGNDGVVYLAEIAAGKPKDTDEITNWKWYPITDIPWEKLRPCCVGPLKKWVENRFGKSLQGMLALEALEKAKIKDNKDVVSVDKKHALKLAGVGVYRFLKNHVKDMGDESFKDIDFDTHTIHIRKHTDGNYSGRISNGHKTVYKYVNKPLHALAAVLMSIFEWYLPEDESLLDLMDDDSIDDDVIQGGLKHLMDNYRRHNLGEIYQEMETIREEIRNGVAVDLQQVEAKILKLFDKLEEATKHIADQHNKLTQDAGRDLDELEEKLRDLQAKIDEMESPSEPKTVEAFSANPANDTKVYNRLYSYLSRPKVEIHPSGKITICFEDDWDDLEQSNFLEDLRAKVVSKKTKKGK